MIKIIQSVVLSFCFFFSTLAFSGAVNINTASLDELQAISGVGQKKAEAIIAYREENGRFQTAEDLMNVSGFGEKSFERIKTSITVK